mmetsp:Transcript_35216/g.59366  ORF Transcript_35216/g.59366 Transcript_35216/m.59366 type:complete len:281 (+) Transcript_35216:1048-1890(+)
MPGSLPQVQLRDVRAVDQLVPVVEMGILPVGLDLMASHRSLWVPQHQPPPRALLDGEEVEVGPDLAVVAPRRLRLHKVVRLQLLLRLPRRAVDALQLVLVLVATPVCARNRLQLDGTPIQVTGGLHMGARAQVPPLIADVVDGDGLRKAREDLELVRLVDRSDAARGLLARHLFAHKRQLLVDDLVHLLLDLLQVGGRERFGISEVVVEPSVDPGTDRALRVLEELLDRHRHHVSGRVTDTEQIVGLFARQKLHVTVVLDLRLSFGVFLLHLGRNGLHVP